MILSQKQTFFSFGFDGLKKFVIQDDQKVIKKILFGTEQMTRTDNKTTLVNIRFNLNACKNLSKKELDTGTNFFHFIQAFGNKLKLRDFVNIWMVEDRVQGLNPVTCGIFKYIFMRTCLIQTKPRKYKIKNDLTKEQ